MVAHADHELAGSAGEVDLEQELSDRWLVSAAGRFEDYSDFGTETTWKLATLRRQMPDRKAWTVLMALVGKALGHIQADDSLFTGAGLARALVREPGAVRIPDEPRRTAAATTFRSA